MRYVNGLYEICVNTIGEDTDSSYKFEVFVDTEFNGFTFGNGTHVTVDKNMPEEDFVLSDKFKEAFRNLKIEIECRLRKHFKSTCTSGHFQIEDMHNMINESLVEGLHKL